MDRFQELISKKWIVNGRFIQTDGKDDERETLALLDRLNLPNHNTDYYTRDRIGQLMAESPAMYETLKAMLELLECSPDLRDPRALRAREIIQRIENP
jgi:hypothetical protein